MNCNTALKCVKLNSIFLSSSYERQVNHVVIFGFLHARSEKLPSENLITVLLINNVKNN